MNKNIVETSFIIENKLVKKKLFFKDNKLSFMTIENRLLKTIYEFVAEEFIINFKRDESAYQIKSSMCEAKIEKSKIIFTYNDITIIESYRASEKEIFKNIDINSKKEIFIDSIICDTYDVGNSFSWRSNVPKVDLSPFGSVVKPYILSLGQPVYFKSIFTAFVFPASDNTIKDNKVELTLFLGKSVTEYKSYEVVLGVAEKEEYYYVRKAFFEYIDTFARKKSVYMTFNSWFDHMLNISEDNILSSFEHMFQGFKNANLRPLNCYVVDDGWCDRTKKEFWGFNDKTFPNKFSKICELTHQMESKFGVWFGPRGGYENTQIFATNLAEMGYPKNCETDDICVANKKYIQDLCAKMKEFMLNYNVEYFKIDGFARLACKDDSHGHAVGGRDGVCFYTSLYDVWLEELTKLKSYNPDLFINLTTYTHCSPFFLTVASSLWINNSYDFGFAQVGDSLEAEISYKDNKYYDLIMLQQAQLPPQYIYNHEPIYANECKDTRLPLDEQKKLDWSDEQFEKYLYACVMRGSGFVEFYYSFDLMENGNKFSINTKVYKFLEDNFDILSKVSFYGGDPMKEEIYGFIGCDKNNIILSIRNPSSKTLRYDLDLHKYSEKKQYTIEKIFDKENANYFIEDGVLRLELKAFELIILKL